MSKTKVKMTKDMGRGVFAAETINKKIVVESSPCIDIDDDSYEKTQDSILRFYVFEGRNKRHSVLALGVGSLFNHNKNANVKYKYDAKRNVMTFIAKRKIYAGEQLFIDYGYDPVIQYKTWHIRKVREKDEQQETLKQMHEETREFKLLAETEANINRSGDMVRLLGVPTDRVLLTSNNEHNSYIPKEIKPLLFGFGWKLVSNDDKVVQYTKVGCKYGYSKLIGRLFFKSKAT